MKERGNSFLRFCDRYGGIPLVLILSLFKRKRKKLPLKLTTISLVKLAGIGDLALMTAVILDLKKAFPKAHIRLFTGLGNAEMGRLIDEIEVVALPVTKPFHALKIVRKYRSDVWLDFDPWPRINALFSFFSPSMFKIGFKTKGQYRHFLYDAVVQHSDQCHELDNFRALTQLLKIECNHLPALDFKGRLQKKKRVSIHIFPGGSRAHLKRWPLENWDEIISYVTDLGYEVVLTGSVRDRPLLERWASWKKVVNLAGLSLAGTAEELLSSTVVLSVDTGIMHLAGILGCPLIALHGPTSPKRWGAFGKNVYALSPKMNYTPCLSLGFEKRCHKNRCMQAITVHDVKMALEKILKEGNKDENRASRGRSGQEVMASF